jgi:hypothetical protein
MTSQGDYSRLDRLTHRIAFLSRIVQLTAADLEKGMFGPRFRDVPVERPIFITSLPRAGTTLLLEILARHPDLATHTYRDMPFVMTPVLWDQVSRGFRKKADPKERAHGDGMEVGYDSPEAFEEILWKAHWPGRFKGGEIPLWGADQEAAEFRKLLSAQMQKIIALRSAAVPGRSRYISKNNANVGRVPFLRKLFPDCIVVVPVRNPVDQAASMRRQHQRFGELHRRERFSKRYMKDIGHFEFGQLHRPLAFPGIGEVRDRFDPDGLDYWIGYWLAAFTALLEHQDEVVLVSYESLCQGGAEGMRRLTEALALPDEGFAELSAESLRAPLDYELDLRALDAGQLEEALALHARLTGSGVV